MAIEGLEIAPSGIGSGEAQVIKTPFTEKAFLYAIDSENKRKAAEEEQFAAELGKIDTNGIHSYDAEEINKKYQELIDTYANVKQSKDRNERLKNKILYEQKKKDLLMDISQSKNYSKKLFSIGEKIIGSEKGAFEDDAIAKFKRYSTMPSKGVVIDEFEFMKKPKEEDLLKVKSEIIKYSQFDKQQVGAGSVAGRPGVVSTTTFSIDPQRYADGWSMTLQKNPTMQTYLEGIYRSEYEKSPEYAKNGDAGFLQYAINQEYKKDEAAERQKQKQSFNDFYVPNDNNATFNFGGGYQNRSVPTNQQPSAYLNVTSQFQVNDPKNPNKKITASRKENIPVYNRVKYSKSFPVDLSATGGYYSIDQNKMITSPTEIQSFNSVYIQDIPYAITNDGSLKPISEASVKSLISQGFEGKIQYIPSLQGTLANGENIAVRIDQMPENILDEKDFIRAYEKYQQGGSSLPSESKAKKTVKNKYGI